MPTFETLEPLDKQFFHVEWETTLKCNLDCSYCGTGHDNSIPHPSLDDSIKTIDFILEYVDLYLQDSSDNLKHVNLNIFGGESLFHPNILEILIYARERRKQYSNFTFNVSTITNAVVGKTLWTELVEYLDYLTVSYHAEALPKQQDMVRTNILYLKEREKNFHVSIMMHPNQWDNCINMIEWCKANDVKYNARQLDIPWTNFNLNYKPEQVEYLYGKVPKTTIVEKTITFFKDGINLSSKGRECCGRANMCTDKQYNNPQTFIPGNNFKGWSCGVNRFFVYIKQTTGEVFTNKDCLVNFEGKVGPIGYLKQADKILDDLKSYVETGDFPVITCAKKTCFCGLCTPKAKTREQYDDIIKKYRKQDI